MRRTRWGAALAVVVLHAGGVAVLLLPPQHRTPPAPAAVLALRLLSAPVPEPLPVPVPMPARRPAVRSEAPRAAPISVPVLVLPGPAAIDPAADRATPANAWVPAKPLDLRLPAAGPQARQALRADSLPGVADRLRRDSRANSPRLSLDERVAVALGTPCFVDEPRADGDTQRFPGVWVALPNQSDAIWQGVTGALGVGGKAPPIAVAVCKRQ